jgi:iron uptake system EfeUOB component EfeO/EfeM
MEVCNLLKPQLMKTDPALVTEIEYRQTVESALAAHTTNPGHYDTGYVEYSKVLDPRRRQPPPCAQASAESLSNMSDQVS